MFNYKAVKSDILKEVKVFTPEPFTDYRGTMWTHWEWPMNTPTNKISKFTRSRKNVLRGLHCDYVTWKHITCVYGAFYLVVVDYREDSPTYLSDECVFHYTQSYPDDYIDWEEQETVKWNDPMLKINWPIGNPILSRRDKCE